MKIYKRDYDNAYDKQGNPKENQFLGDFNIIETIFEDTYASSRIGIKDGKVYLISEEEVGGFNGGSRFEIKEIKSLKPK